MRNRAASSRRSATRLTPRGWVFLVVGLFLAFAAYGNGGSALLYAGFLLTVLVLAAALFVRLKSLRLSVVRTFSPSVVPAESEATVDLQVTNLALTPSSAATWADRIPWAPGTAGPGLLKGLSASVAGYSQQGSSTVLRYTLRPPARGVYPIGPLEVEYSDPFGLVRGKASLGGIQQLSVVPAVVPFGASGPSILAGDGSARLVQRRTSGSDDDLMTREYRNGDALRRVHWRASARHGELMVRQEEQRTFPEARLLFDTRRDGYGDAWTDLGGRDGGIGAFEWAVRMVASLGYHLHRGGFRVEVLETAPAQIAPLGEANRGGGQELDFLLSLAEIEPSRVPLRAGPRPEPQAEGSPGPIFAVLAEPELETLRWIAAQRRPREFATAFVIGSGSRRATELLSRAGWTCVPVRELDDPALAWASIGRFTGAGR